MGLRQVDPTEPPQQLGKPIRSEKEKPPEWTQVPGAPPGIERSPDDKLRNNTPTPPWESATPPKGPP